MQNRLLARPVIRRPSSKHKIWFHISPGIYTVVHLNYQGASNERTMNKVVYRNACVGILHLKSQMKAINKVCL